MVPNIVAFGIVFSGFSIFPAGIVAHSIPKKANKVKVATDEKALKSLSEVRLKAGKLSISKKKTPTRMTNTRGSNLKTVLAYSKSDLGTLSENSTLLGLGYDFALAKNVSVNATFSGVVDDFNPAYGLGISYSLGGGQLFAGYAFSDDNIAGIKLEQSAFNVGYSLDF